MPDIEPIVKLQFLEQRGTILKELSAGVQQAYKAEQKLEDEEKQALDKVNAEFEATKEQLDKLHAECQGAQQQLAQKRPYISQLNDDKNKTATQIMSARETAQRTFAAAMETKRWFIEAEAANSLTSFMGEVKQACLFFFFSRSFLLPRLIFRDLWPASRSVATARHPKLQQHTTPAPAPGRSAACRRHLAPGRGTKGSVGHRVDAACHRQGRNRCTDR